MQGSLEPIRVEDMRAIELNAVALGTPLILLMENAGRAVAGEVVRRLGGVRGRRIAVLAGKGGNGGDGFVAARHLAGRGARVEVHLAYPPESVSHPDARVNLEALLRLESVRVIKPLDKGWLELDDKDAVIDALLGTGVKGRLRGPIEWAVREYNKAPGLRVSIDVPTGVNPDTGQAVPGAAVSDITVTMHRPKRGLLRARQYTGEIVVADIGIPPEAWRWAGPGDVQARIPKRPKDAHKGVGGRVLVVAGSRYYVGAPMLTAIAAAMTGVDLVTIAAPEKIAFETAAQCSSIIPAPLQEDILTPGDVQKILGLLEKAHSLAIGPGLGRDQETLEAANRIIMEAARRGIPTVIDADALNALPQRFSQGSTTIITPHRGEAKRLTGIEDPKKAAQTLAKKLDTVALVKGPTDYACNKNTCRENHTGHPALSVGGTGDVLTGITAAILAKRKAILKDPDPLNTAITAAYIVGRTGEILAEEKGETLTAWVIVENIPRILKDPIKHSTT